MLKVQDAAKTSVFDLTPPPPPIPQLTTRQSELVDQKRPAEPRWDLVAVARKRMRSDFYNHPAIIEFAAESLISTLE